MLMWVMQVGVVLSTLFYAWFVIRISVGIRRLAAGSSPAILSATVIVAARDEEHTIERCLSSLLEQDYPVDHLDIIVVDDDSHDATASLVEKIHTSTSRVRLLRLPPQADLLTGRKPTAIALGVSEARSDIILTTDADCIHPRQWVRTMVSHFSAETALVAGPVMLEHRPGIFPMIERFEFLGLIVSGAGLIGARRPIICSGANLAYRRSAYNAVRDNVQVSSNDDGTLMSRIVTRHLGGVDFALESNALVLTPGTYSFRGFFRQRIRWASVGGRFLDWTIYAELVFLFLFFVFLAAGSLLLVFDIRYVAAVSVGWGTKIFVDWIALRSGSQVLGIKVPILAFLAAELFHPLAIVLSTILGLVSPFSWKGRKFKR